MNWNARARLIISAEDARRELEAIGCDAGGIPIMKSKMINYAIKLERVKTHEALIIKQEMLAVGGEAAYARGVITNEVESTDILLSGSLKQYRIFLSKIEMQPFDLRDIAAEIQRVLDNVSRPVLRSIDCRGMQVKIGGGTAIMGILNVTPDSFSDGGRFNEPDAAIAHARSMAREGAHIIDIGGESTRPFSEPVSIDEELERVMPVIEGLRGIDVPISIDTYKPEVARLALEAGASMINDVSGLRNPEMRHVAAEYDAPVVIMHMKGEPRSMQENPSYDDVMGEIISYLREQSQTAINEGISPEKIIVDPGIGFGKKRVHNLEILRRLRELRSLGFPVLVGASRKSFIGESLDLPADERLEATIASHCVGIMNGADIVRVHDVKEMSRAIRITDAILAGE